MTEGDWEGKDHYEMGVEGRRHTHRDGGGGREGEREGGRYGAPFVSKLFPVTGETERNIDLILRPKSQNIDPIFQQKSTRFSAKKSTRREWLSTRSTCTTYNEPSKYS